VIRWITKQQGDDGENDPFVYCSRIDCVEGHEEWDRPNLTNDSIEYKSVGPSCDFGEE